MVRHVRLIEAMGAWTASIWGAAALAVGFAAGCAATPEELDDDALAGGEQALGAYDVTSYVAVAPPEVRIVTARSAALVGRDVAIGRTLFVIRSLTFQGRAAQLVVDAESLETAVIERATLEGSSRLATTGDAVDTTPYARSLAELGRTHDALESIDPEANTTGVDEPFALTIDMCQSRKPWDRRLFEWATEMSARLRRPTPIGVAMTGGWAKAHRAELDELVEWDRSGKLEITWINHSSTHPLHCLDSSCRRAEFLTASSVDFDEEVLGLERALLTRGLAPSPIFRFPGLIHDEHRMTQLSRLSLMPLDADAWIAKGQGIKPRAVVLVHGNGNEPEGIRGFFREVETPARQAAIASGKSALVSPLLVAPAPPR